MKSCCTLHNMLLSYDGIGMEAYLDETMWDRVDPDLPDDLALQEDDVVLPTFNGIDEEPEIPFVRTNISVAVMNNIPLSRQFGTRATAEYHDLRALLVTHFNMKLNMQQIVWPKSISSNQRVSIGYFSRAKQDAENALYHKPSNLFLRGNNGEYRLAIGHGLFSHIMYQGKRDTAYGTAVGEPIAKFQGDVKTREEYNEDARQERGGYAIGLPGSMVLDCFAKYTLGKCKGSWANCHKNCFNNITRQVAKYNAYITVDNIKQIVQLRALTNIVQPHTEILWDYGDEYIYPIVN